MRLTGLTPRQQNIYDQHLERENRPVQQEEEAEQSEDDSGTGTETEQEYEESLYADKKEEGTESDREETEEPEELETSGIEEKFSMEDYTDELPIKKPKINDEIVPVLESNGSLQDKITKGIKDIFAGIVKGEWEEEEDFLESYAIEPKISIADVIPPETVEENMKDIQEEDPQESEGEEAPEDSPAGPDEKKEGPHTDPEENQEEEIQEAPQEETQEETETSPVLEDGESEIINTQELEENPSGTDEDKETETAEEQPRKWHVLNSERDDKEGFDVEKLPKLDLSEFNLEEVILSAAEKQGIDVPDQKDGEMPYGPQEEQQEDSQESLEDGDDKGMELE